MLYVPSSTRDHSDSPAPPANQAAIIRIIGNEEKYKGGKEGCRYHGRKGGREGGNERQRERER